LEEVGFHEKLTGEMRARYDNLTKRIEMIYEDKPDGKIQEEFWFNKHEEYKQE